MIREEEVYQIGQINKPHGVKGELSFTFTDDVFDRVEADYLLCKMDGILVPFYFESYRFRSDNAALIKFERVDTAEQARRFTNVAVYAPIAWAAQSPSEEVIWDYFVGFRLVDIELGEIGVVTAVDDSTLNTLFVVAHYGRELLIPAQEELIVEINHAARRISMCLPTGLLEL